MAEIPTKPLNIILLLTDQLRVDYVGRGRECRMATPNLDALCGDHVFHRCTSVNPVCQPARTALLTGRYTRQIGTIRMSGDLDRDIPTFTQVLQRNGYHTIGVGKFHYLQAWDWHTPRGQGHDLVSLRPQFHKWGFDQVWQVCGKSQLLRNTCDYAEILEKADILKAYRDDVDARGKNLVNAEREDVDCSPFRFDPELYVDRVIGAKAIEFLDKRPRDKAFFAQISFCCPHPPYDPPAESLEQVQYEEVDDFVHNGQALADCQKAVQYRKRRAYKAMIHEVDEQVGQLHEYLVKEGLMENTVILFSSDHGELMGDHGLSQKTSPYWQASRVPLYVRHPMYRDRHDHSCLVENIDITGTILDIAGLDPAQALGRSWPAGQATIPARSLMPVISGKTREHREFLFSESYGIWEMIESRDFKYVRQLPDNGSRKAADLLWDIRSDPNEITNLAAEPEFKEQLAKACEQRQHIHEHFTPCQTRWTHL